MKKFMRDTAAAACLLAALAVGASAQQTTPAPQRGVEGREGRHEGPRRGDRKRSERGSGLRAISRLTLSDEQRAQLRVLRENLHRNTETQRAELRQLFEGRAEGEPLTDEQRARAGQLRDEMRQAGESHHQQVLDLLTPEQRAQLEQWKQERRQRREERRQRRQSRAEIL